MGVWCVLTCSGRNWQESKRNIYSSLHETPFLSGPGPAAGFKPWREALRASPRLSRSFVWERLAPQRNDLHAHPTDTHLASATACGARGRSARSTHRGAPRRHSAPPSPAAPPVAPAADLRPKGRAAAAPPRSSPRTLRSRPRARRAPARRRTCAACPSPAAPRGLSAAHGPGAGAPLSEGGGGGGRAGAGRGLRTTYMRFSPTAASHGSTCSHSPCTST